MIDSADKRKAALSFGFLPGAVTLRPGSNTVFRRGSRLSLYPIVGFERKISGGWKLGRSNRVWKVWRKS